MAPNDELPSYQRANPSPPHNKKKFGSNRLPALTGCEESQYVIGDRLKAIAEAADAKEKKLRPVHQTPGPPPSYHTAQYVAKMKRVTARYRDETDHDEEKKKTRTGSFSVASRVMGAVMQGAVGHVKKAGQRIAAMGSAAQKSLGAIHQRGSQMQALRSESYCLL